MLGAFAISPPQEISHSGKPGCLDYRGADFIYWKLPLRILAKWVPVTSLCPTCNGVKPGTLLLQRGITQHRKELHALCMRVTPSGQPRIDYARISAMSDTGRRPPLFTILVKKRTDIVLLSS